MSNMVARVHSLHAPCTTSCIYSGRIAWLFMKKSRHNWLPLSQGQAQVIGATDIQFAAHIGRNANTNAAAELFNLLSSQHSRLKCPA